MWCVVTVGVRRGAEDGLRMLHSLNSLKDAAQPRLGASLLCVATALITLPAHSVPFRGVSHTVTGVNGLSVDQYSWYDSAKRLRTVSLKQEGNGNPGHGGYAVQMTYQTGSGKTITVNAESGGDGGFGYFVSHERYRTFTDGANDTIASHVFHTDDSPLGLSFPAVGQVLATKSARGLAHQFTMTYRHYGTILPITKNPDGDDVNPTPTDPTQLALYPMPITITWVFQGGTDYPRIDYAIDLSQIAKPDRVNFDVRGPYGVMVFDNEADGLVDTAMWGDRYHFATTTDPATRNSAWTWSEANNGARYNALTAGSYEMGLFEPNPFSESQLADGYADERGSTSVLYNNGHGCEGEVQIIPCDWEWPYQSIQFSLPYDNNNEPTNFKKMAWGSTAYYGSGKSLPRVWDTSTTSVAFKGWPRERVLRYSICVVLGLTTPKGLTHDAAASYKGCATTKPS
jgi:hypothetical protein